MKTRVCLKGSIAQAVYKSRTLFISPLICYVFYLHRKIRASTIQIYDAVYQKMSSSDLTHEPVVIKENVKVLKYLNRQ